MPELVCAASDPRWADERRKGVTATDITAIIGLSPYESEYSLYWKKLGHIPDVREDNDRLRLGRDLESLIVARWLEAAGLHELAFAATLWRNSVRPWQMATIDADALDGPLEVKSWADADKTSWADTPPPRVRARVLWQMDTLDVAVGHVGVLFLPSGEFRSYVIEHVAPSPAARWCIGECQACEDISLMRKAGEEFMARLRLELPPPSPDASSATLAALKARFADPAKTKEAEIDPVLIHGWDRGRKKRAEGEDEVAYFENLIREYAGDAGILTVNGVKVATRQRYTVKAHMRKESTVDKIIRSKGESNDGS